jgi:hypothetical protein
MRQRAGIGQQRQSLDAQDASSLAAQSPVGARQRKRHREDRACVHGLLEIPASRPSLIETVE